MADVVERSGIHLTGADSGWPVASSAEPDPHKDGTGADPHTAAAEVANNVVQVSERQQIVVKAGAGQWKLTFEGQQTADLAYNISAANLKAALEGLSNVGVGDVEVTGGPGNAAGSAPYVITFQGALAESDRTQITTQAGTTPLSGGTGGSSATVTTTTPGS